MTLETLATDEILELTIELGAVVRNKEGALSTKWGLSKTETRRCIRDGELQMGDQWVEVLEIRSRPLFVPETVIWTSEVNR